MTVLRIPDRAKGLDALIPRRAFWGLFAVAALVFVLDAILSYLAVGRVPMALEQNPIAAGAMDAGITASVGFKLLVLGQVAVTAHVLRRLDADWAARVLFAVVTIVGAWGVGTAIALLIA